MKKILIITMAIFMLLPITNAFASPVGYFDTNSYGATGTSNIATLYDNNNTTGIGVSGYGAYTTLAVLSNPIDIEQIYWAGIVNTNVKLYFYDNANSIIKIIATTTLTSGSLNVVTPILNVSSIKVLNSASGPYSVNEFDVLTATPQVQHNPVTNLTETHNHNTVNLNWTNPNVAEFIGTTIKQNGVEVAQLANNTSGYSINNLSAETTYNFEVIARYSDSVDSTSESIQVVTEPIPIDDTAPSDISSVLVEQTDTTSSFIYSLPIDTDFSHLDIYRNGALLKTGHTLNTFDDVALVPNTSYVYKFVSVDASGNQSNGYTQTVLTNAEVDNQAPTAPTGVVTANGNGGGTVTWDSSTDTDLNGYNVFVNGTKHNTTLIKATTYVVPNLTNDETYQITVSAVDTSGNESLQSEISTITPNKSEMPVYEMKYSLKDVADGTSSWFGSIWLILAFSVAIPLTFLVARRIKDLFLA